MSLSLAAEEQSQAGSQNLRDAMIGQALDEGQSIPDIAEAVGLSEAAIYKIQAARRKEPRGPQGAGSDQRAVIAALEHFSDHVRFEELVSALIGDIDPAAIPLGGPGDRGRDAANPDSSTIFTISLQRQWKRKVESDLEKIAKYGFKPERIYAVTNRRTARKTVEQLIESAAESGISLTVLDQKWLVAKLSQAPRLHLRSGFLNIAPPRSSSFLTPEEYRTLLDGRPHLSGLSVHFSGRVAERRRATELLEAERIVMLSGAGGYGKTRLALELAGEDDGEWRFIDSDMQFTPESISELPLSDRLVVVIDNVHRRDHLSSLLSALERLPAGPPRVVLLTRPFQLEKLNSQIAGSWLGAIDAARMVEIGPLGWRTMAEILKAPPLGIKSGEQRRAIIQLAEGNPQIAVIAARVAAERRSVVGLSGDELLQRYIAYLIPTAIATGSDVRRQRKLLALLAALDGIEDDEEDLLIEVAEMLRMNVEQIKDGLEQLAESGLVIADLVRRPAVQRYRIKPDLLAEHVLFALTLTERWDLTLDYGQIFERFGERHLLRLAKAIGALPASLFDSELAERLDGLERELAKVVTEGDPGLASELIRELCHARPEVAQRQAVALLSRITASGAKPEEQVINRLREGAMRMSDFPRSWRLLLLLGAECAGQQLASLKAIGESMSATYERVPDGEASSGAVLAAVQDSLAIETRRFWDKHPPGAASAVALAVKPMLMVTFEISRTSPDNPMSVELGGRILPISPYTEEAVKTGGELAAQAFAELVPSEQLKLIETVGRAAHAAAGFPLSMGRTTPTAGRVLLDGALENVDLLLAQELENLEMPVRRAAYDFLLKRARYRRKLAEDIGEDEVFGRNSFGPVTVPLPSAELEEFIFMINSGQVGPPEREHETIEKEYERRRAQAAQRAEALRSDPEWRAVLDRWSSWWQKRRELEGERAALGQTPGMVFEALAATDPELGVELIDHLIATDSGLRGASTGAMLMVIDALSPQRWKKWLSADPTVRAALARALSNFDEAAAGEAMRRLAFDEDEIVRSAATDALTFSLKLERWRFDLGLEAVTRYPDIEAVNQLLHMADEHAKRGGKEHAEFDEDQVERIEAAILATAASEKMESYALADSLRRAERPPSGLAMRWIWARLDALEEIGSSRRESLHLWDLDFLDEELGPIVSRAADTADLKRALERFERAEEHSPVLTDLAKVIGWIDPGASEVTAVMVRLLENPKRSWLARSHLTELPLTNEQLDQRAHAFAAALEEPLPALLDLLAGTLPRSWSGSYVPHLESARATAERWAGSNQRQLRAAGHDAVASYQAQIKQWSAREEADDRRFEYS